MTYTPLRQPFEIASSDQSYSERELRAMRGFTRAEADRWLAQVRVPSRRRRYDARRTLDVLYGHPWQRHRGYP